MNSDSIFDTISPTDFGLPPKFTAYRGPQREALEWLNACEAPISAALLPTGIGKTLLAVSLAKLLGVKAVYLVATKALQSQVLSDFRSISMVDVRGRANYECENYDDCERGYDAECSLHNSSGCPYSVAVEAARRAPLTVTNYAYWLNARRYNSSALEFADPVQLLICDEAHALESQLTGFAAVRVKQREIGRVHHWADQSGVLTEENPQTAVWTNWANDRLAKCKQTKDTIKKLQPNNFSKDDRWKDADDLEDRCKRILRMSANWVWQFDERGNCAFEPIRLNGFCSALFSGVPRVLLMSASLNDFTLRLLMGRDDVYDYRAWGQVFPPQNAPVYLIPTRKLSWKSTDEDYQAIIEAADAIIDNRLDRNGIIHTVSYARTRRALQYSRYANRFIWNETGKDLTGCLAKFRNGDVGNILVTPSVEEGFDFPESECEYQIVLKFPFPNETNRVIKERCAQITGYRLQYAAQKIIQMRGRPVRSYTDRAEMFILDSAAAQLNGPEGRSYLPPGFRMFTLKEVPKAPPRIGTT